MEVDIVVPALGESIVEVTIAKWCKKVGDKVENDECLLEVATEKATLEINATASGVISKILQNEGNIVSIGSIVGIIDTDISLKIKNNTQKQESLIIERNDNDLNLQSNTHLQKGGVNNLSPAVAHLIAEHNLDSNSIIGSGRDGRIKKSDILEIIDNKKYIQNTALNKQNLSSDVHRKEERVSMSVLRQTIAKRLKESQNNAAILSTFNEIDMSRVMEIRSKYGEQFKEKHNTKLGFMSFFVKSVISALQSIPIINAEIIGNDIIYKYYYDIGIAVGTEKGLVVPIIKNAELLNFAEIEQRIIQLAQKAREGKLSIEDLTGGTFSITNGGIYGSLLSTPIINPPQSGILGLHSIQKRAVVINDKIEIRPMMYIALSYDHRIIDGKDAVSFLVKIKEFLEDPDKFLLGLC